MKIKYAIFQILLLGSPLTAIADIIRGQVTDEEYNPLSFASVRLLRNDSTFVSGTTTDDNGIFILDDMNIAGCLLNISYIGYTEQLISTGCIESGIIRLAPDTEILSEVVVKGQRPRIIMKGNAMVTTIEGSVLEKFGTATRLLDRIPNVKVTGQEAEVFGSGKALIYINGRELRDFSELERISADNIRQIEVESNPGSKYGAAVKSVIRIVTKSAPGDGYSIDNRLFSGFHSGWDYAEQLCLNYRKGSFDIGGSVSWKDFSNRERKTIVQDTYSDKFTLSQHSATKSNLRSQNLNGELTINYRLGETSSVGVRYNYSHQPKDDGLFMMNTDVKSGGLPYEQSISETAVNNGQTRHDLSCYYTGKAGKMNIEVNADALWMNTDISSSADERVLPMNNSNWMNIIMSSSTESRSSLYAAKLQLTNPIYNGNLAVGGEYIRTSRYNNYRDSFSDSPGGDMSITENMAYAFTEYECKSGSVQWRIGLRYELINSAYYENGERLEPQSRICKSIFPFASIYVPIGNVKFRLSYRSGTERPTYWQLRDNITYVNRYTYEGGNPMLRPMTSYKASLASSYSWVSLTADFTHLKNGIVSTYIPYSDNPMTGLLTYKQWKPYNRINVSLTLSPVIGIWSPRWGIQITQNRFVATTPDGDKKMHNPVAMFTWHNSIRLPHDFVIGFDMGYTTGGDMENTAYGVLWRADAMIYKGFMNNRLSLSLNMEDIFQSSGATNTLYTPTRILQSIVKSDISVGLTLRYKFNLSQGNYKGKGAGGEQKSRL